MARVDIDIDYVFERIEGGMSFSELAPTLNCTVATLRRALTATPELIARLETTRTFSAEAWLDKGIDAVKQAMNKDSLVDATAARAFASECARRAAIRNPLYRDKAETTINAGTGFETLLDLASKK